LEEEQGCGLLAAVRIDNDLQRCCSAGSGRKAATRGIIWHATRADQPAGRPGTSIGTLNWFDRRTRGSTRREPGTGDVALRSAAGVCRGGRPCLLAEYDFAITSRLTGDEDAPFAPQDIELPELAGQLARYVSRRADPTRGRRESGGRARWGTQIRRRDAARQERSRPFGPPIRRMMSKESEEALLCGCSPTERPE
jgi:hypothetical protein